jgi:cell division septation protein DedD
MAKPGNISVTTEVGYCPFCGRTRNLRREDRKLGGLVRSTLECETCHRTLSSTMGPVVEEPAKEPEPIAAPEEEPSPQPSPAKRARAKPAPKKAAAAKKPTTAKRATTARKPTTTKKTTTKKK